MSQINAEFESVDLAELAARNVRYKFEGVQKIRIRYHAGAQEDERLFVPAFSSTGTAGYPNEVGVGGYYQAVGAETERIRSAILMIDAGEDSTKRIAAYLRGLGGINIKISEGR